MSSWKDIVLGINEDLPACDFGEAYMDLTPTDRVTFGFYGPRGNYIGAKTVDVHIMVDYIHRHEQMSNGTPPTKEHMAYLVYMGALPSKGGAYVQEENPALAVRTQQPVG